MCEGSADAGDGECIGTGRSAGARGHGKRRRGGGWVWSKVPCRSARQSIHTERYRSTKAAARGDCDAIACRTTLGNGLARGRSNNTKVIRRIDEPVEDVACRLLDTRIDDARCAVVIIQSVTPGI